MYHDRIPQLILLPLLHILPLLHKTFIENCINCQVESGHQFYTERKMQRTVTFGKIMVRNMLSARFFKCEFTELN